MRWFFGFCERGACKFVCVRACLKAALSNLYFRARSVAAVAWIFYRSSRDLSPWMGNNVFKPPVFQIHPQGCAATRRAATERMKFNNCTNKTSANQHGKCPLGSHALVCVLYWKFFFDACEEFLTHFSTPRRFRFMADLFFAFVWPGATFYIALGFNNFNQVSFKVSTKVLYSIHICRFGIARNLLRPNTYILKDWICCVYF